MVHLFASARSHRSEPRRGKAAQAASVTRRPTLLELVRLQRIDVLALVAMTVVAFVFRFFSPILPNFIADPFGGSPISDCVSSTPIDAKGDLGTLCGLAYPFTR